MGVRREAKIKFKAEVFGEDRSALIQFELEFFDDDCALLVHGFEFISGEQLSWDWLCEHKPEVANVVVNVIAHQVISEFTQDASSDTTVH